MITDFSSGTKASTERKRNLTNMRHLFHRRTDERGQTFPFRLASDSQAVTKLSRCVHYRIVRERCADFGQWMIKREVMCDRGLRILRTFSKVSAGSRCHVYTQ